MAQAAGAVVQDLEPLPIPKGWEEVLEAFWVLRSVAGATNGTIHPIRHSDILAWQELTGVVLEPVEAGIIFALDQAAIKAFSEVTT